MNIPPDLRYATSHEWIRQDGVVGITDHAQSSIGDVAFVELPAVGRVVKAGDAVAIVESVKAANDIYAPMGGTIKAVNEDLKTNPALINADAHGAGWLFQIDLPAGADFSPLLDADAYAALIGS